MRKAIYFLIPAVLLALLSTGCYTKLYRPGMDARTPWGPEGQLYERYDSTMIDTTLVRPEYEDYDGWYYWGRPRPQWGWDPWGYQPGYYSGYYGYYDYYSTPWWYSYYDPWWGNYGPSKPVEPPAKRDGRRDRRAPRAGDGSYSPPPASGGTYSPPPTSSPPPPSSPPPRTKDGSKDQNKGSSSGDSSDSNKRSGKRGR